MAESRQHQSPCGSISLIGKFKDVLQAAKTQQHDARTQCIQKQQICRAGRKTQSKRRGRRSGRTVWRQGLSQVAITLEPLARLLFQATLDGLRKARGNRRSQFPRVRNALFQHGGDHLHGVPGFERRPACEQIKQSRPHRIHVRTQAQFVSAKLFGRTKCWSAKKRVGRGKRRFGPNSSRNRQTEVANLNRPFGVHETIGWLDVPMKDADALGGFQPGDNLQHAIDRFRGGQRALRIHAVLQRPTGNQFHGDHRCAGDFFGSKNIHTVWVIDRCGQTSLAQKTFPGGRRIQSLTQNFQRHAPPALQVIRFKHRPHPAFAQKPHHAIMAQLFGGLRQTAAPRSASPLGERPFLVVQPPAAQCSARPGASIWGKADCPATPCHTQGNYACSVQTPPYRSTIAYSLFSIGYSLSPAQSIHR